ncbi:NADH-quinone oxidoreductase subunit C [Streptomyces lunaelactis]|uniref:NADH-quinone oxidoreductase subunit C n=5 Tax=Streptomyces lunaelactis TaxID=1535768 RepID=UPI001585D1BC|nr:NADH-quinone oxidoreductase subunit C [Streptomyces lunaelactis]
MNPYDRLPDAAAEIFGEEATAERQYDLLTVDVPVGSWIVALEIARDKLGCTYFDWLSAVDEPGTGFRVCAHVVSLEGRKVRRLLVRTTVSHEAPELPSAVGIYAGAGWHERETHEMFGVDFTDHPHLVPLLLPEGFEGYPLRKDFILAARVVKAWPGAKEPGESEHGGPKRRQMLPPGVPDPNEWGPLKGQLPPAPTRPARAARTAGAAGTPGERPARRTRSASEGSASQAQAEVPASAEPSEAPAVQPRRARTASEGPASQQAPGRTGSPDAPWHHARPAFDEAAASEAPAAEPAEPEARPAPAAEAPAAPPTAEPVPAAPIAEPAPAEEATPDEPAQSEADEPVPDSDERPGGPA